MPFHVVQKRTPGVCIARDTVHPAGGRWKANACRPTASGMSEACPAHDTGQIFGRREQALYIFMQGEGCVKGPPASSTRHRLCWDYATAAALDGWSKRRRNRHLEKSQRFSHRRPLWGFFLCNPSDNLLSLNWRPRAAPHLYRRRACTTHPKTGALWLSWYSAPEASPGSFWS